VIPVREWKANITSLNTEILMNNKQKFEGCFGEDSTPREASFNYRIRHIETGFLDIFSSNKVSEGCIACFKRSDKIPAHLEINLNPSPSSVGPVQCMKNIMYDLKFKFSDHRFESEDVNISIRLF